jgi:hypothetical protein
MKRIILRIELEYPGKDKHTGWNTKGESIGKRAHREADVGHLGLMEQISCRISSDLVLSSGSG